MDPATRFAPNFTIKRLIDLAGATLGLILFSPVILTVIVAIRFSSRGPILFSQERTGRHGRIFRIYKFRTMIPATTVDQNREAREDDPRITRIGRFLRRSGLDELPQLVNVLRGEMSLVGPRPLLSWENNLCNPCQSRRLHVQPGLTGLAQVRGRNAIPWAQRVEWDVIYVETRTIRLDLLILFQTIPTVAFGRNAYDSSHPRLDAAAPRNRPIRPTEVSMLEPTARFGNAMIAALDHDSLSIAA